MEPSDLYNLTPIDKINLMISLIERRLDNLDEQLALLFEKLKLKDELDRHHSTAIQNVQLDIILIRAAMVEFIERYSQAEDEVIPIKDLIEKTVVHLSKLKEQEAKFGVHCPVYIITEIADYEKKLADLYEKQRHTKTH